MVSLRVGVMQLHKLHKHALELEQSGGGRGRAEAEGLRGGERWAEKGKGGRTMTRRFFLQAVDKLGWPSRVRGDHGTEINAVEQEMIQKRGINHWPYLQGR